MKVPILTLLMGLFLNTICDDTDPLQLLVEYGISPDSICSLSKTYPAKVSYYI